MTTTTMIGILTTVVALVAMVAWAEHEVRRVDKILRDRKSDAGV